ncbi:PKD domain-containing protein [Flavisolibacter ginsenosidimutans]|uniref:PKD domain-containing protein n=1 Tax=Flavisolibacter ginsenosidimutans TaxID=661481 RepID=A0A5B8UK48_9BACT|nr:PKD domain-containing protein [Flavisolibacter ginsenosidimutans]QEC56806.1 PKD domain-containing protein [Flavisolibacter ginsenosidimutans]
MNTASITTRTITGLDYRVWLSILLTWLVCLGWYGYNKMKEWERMAKPCADARIIVNGKDTEAIAVCYPDRIATFRLQGIGAARADWNFGDGTTVSKEAIAQHQYTAVGIYTVVATVNGGCEFRRAVTVTTPLAKTPDKGIIEIIPDSIAPKAGNTVRFYAVCDIVPRSYEWKLIGTNEVRYDSTAAFQFLTAGKYTVQLVVNNNPAMAKTKTIDVAEPPQAPLVNSPLSSGTGGNPPVPGPLFPNDPSNGGQKSPAQNTGASNGGGTTGEPPKTEQAKPKATVIDPDGFKSLLQEVLEGNKEVSDLYPFLDYMGSTKVVVNGKDEMKITDFVREKRKKKIEALDFQKDDKNGIQKIKVKLKRGGILGFLK